MPVAMNVVKTLDSYPTKIGNRKETLIEIRGTSSYPASGGYILKAPFVNLQIIEFVNLVESSGIVTWFPRLTFNIHKAGATQITLKLYVVATNAEVAATTDVSTWIARLLLRGR